LDACSSRKVKIFEGAETMGDILTPVAHVHGAMALSPDGSQLAFVGKSGPSFIRPIDQLEAVVLQIGAAKQCPTSTSTRRAASTCRSV
jgi:hypothetical protein